MRTHPVTGRRALFVSGRFMDQVVGMHRDESDALIGFLQDHAANPNFCVRWHWTVGDVVMWDNRCTRHYAIGDYDDERVMHRVTVLGDYCAPADPASAARWPHHAAGRISAQTAFSLMR